MSAVAAPARFAAILVPFRRFYDPFTLFSFALALFSVFQSHFEMTEAPLLRMAVFTLAIVNLIRPGVPLLIAMLSLSLLIELWQGMPSYSNHVILSFILNMFVFIAFLCRVCRERTLAVDARAMFLIFAPAGRFLLLTMYFFGVFHKLNTDFLNTDASCASALIHYFVFLPQGVLFPKTVMILAAYGTLVIETVIALMLLFRVTLPFAVCAGLFFHFLISLSAFRDYTAFTTLAMSLHFLYLDPRFLGRLRQSAWFKVLTAREFIKLKVGLIVFLVLNMLVYHYVVLPADPTPAILLWAPYGAAWCLLTMIYEWPVRARDAVVPEPVPAERAITWPGYFLAALSGAFFVSCFSPYVGFKTGQTINMFSNLNTENGISNHLIFTRPLHLFNYLDQGVHIIEVSDPDSPLSYFTYPGFEISQYTFEDFIVHAAPTLSVTYQIGGTVKTINGLSPDQAAKWPKNSIARKFMIFSPISTNHPKTCYEPFDMLREETYPNKVRWYKKS